MREIYRLLPTIVAILFIGASACAKDIDKGFIRKHLETSVYAIDSEASAIILYEHTSIQVTLEEHGYRNYSYSERKVVHKVIKILKNDAVDIANVKIFFPENDYLNYVDGIKGVTYTLENGNIVESPLDNKDIYRKNVAGKNYEATFSLPSVKPGCVIEYSYEEVTKNISSMYTWHIQDQYPKLISEYEIEYPERYEFTAISHVAIPVKEYQDIEDAELSPDGYCHGKGQTYTNGKQYTAFWVRKNIDGLKMEPYVRNLNSIKERLELQMTGKMTTGGFTHFDNSWAKLNEELWSKSKLDKQVNGSNNFMNNVVDSLVRIDTSWIGKTTAIYKYVRANFSVSEKSKLRDVQVKYVFDHKEGSIFGINLLLAAMLQHAGINAYPMLLATTAEIPESPAFPVLDRIDYLAVAVKKDSSYLYLDASDKNNIFGSLHPGCYNGYAWVLGIGEGVYLQPDMISNKDICAVKIYDITDSTAAFEVTEKFGLQKSSSLRRSWVKDNSESQKFMDQLERSLPGNVTLINSEVYNREMPDTNIIAKLTCSMKMGTARSGYFINNVLMKYFTENPFKATVRKLPVDFAYKAEYLYYISIKLPDNLVPDSLAQGIVLNYEDGGMIYKRSFSYFPEIHMLTGNSSYAVNITSYTTDYYESMRKFFQEMIKDNDELITLRKK